MKVHVVGGFLGAGKTTAIRALARALAERGERVCVVTNDQGQALVDTALVARDASSVREIGGGCFCCRYPELEAALVAAEESGASVAIAEAVGSCTDLVATVISPLAERYGSRFELAPLAVVVDPARIREVARGSFAGDVVYLFWKQLEEADVILVSRADTDLPLVDEDLQRAREGAAIVRISGKTGEGIGAWLSAVPVVPAAPLVIDYDRYAEAEAGLGWLNARVVVSAEQGFSPRQIVRGALESLGDLQIAHVKIATLSPPAGTAAVVRRGEAPVEDLGSLPETTRRLELLVNARAATDPVTLERAVRSAFDRASRVGEVSFQELAAFAPSRPVPVHRHTYRCGSGDDAACCAAFYERPDVRFLLGDSWHPGGLDLTLRQGEALGLNPGARLLDVACGRGESLRALSERFEVIGSGVDARAPDAAQVDPLLGVHISKGDAHRLSFEDDSFDAAICECALSTFADQRAALLEMRRVLKRCGHIAASDMVVQGELPALLRPYAHQGACLAGAKSEEEWRSLFYDAGLIVTRESDESACLSSMLGRIKRQLVGLALGQASGVLAGGVTIDVRRGRELVREAEQVVRDGRVRYFAWILAPREI